MITSDLKIAVVQMRPTPGAVSLNALALVGNIQEARRRGCDVIVAPELITTAYLLGDLWEHDAFIKEVAEFDEMIRKASTGVTVIWGSVVADFNKIGEDGRLRKYNAARIASNGAWVGNGVLNGFVPKTNLPKYRFFDDARHFYPADKLAEELGVSLAGLLKPFSIEVRDKTYRLALTVCEDLWEDEYASKVSRIYGAQGADLMIDISASPWTAGKWHARERMLTARVQDSGIPILYVNAVGLQNNGKNLIWFDGESSFTMPGKGVVWRAPQHTEGLFPVNLRTMSAPPSRNALREIDEALSCGMRDYLGRFPKFVIGLSGGIDSAVMAAKLARVFGPERVLAVNMPTKFNSQTTRGLAERLAKNLGIEYRVVPIQGLVDAQVKALVGAGFPEPAGLTLENIQARIRGAGVQAALAQQLGGVFLCNGNKTEIALNYFTLYGDGAGVAAFLGDLWKGQVYDLARLMNEGLGYDLIPQGIIDIVPSAELSAEQNVDEGKGDPIFYPYHDQLLRAFTETRWDPTTVLEHALAGDLETALGCAPGCIAKYFPSRERFVTNLEWAWRQYSMDFKRVQTPPIFITSRRAFGFDRRATIADGTFTAAYGRLRSSFLSNV